MTLEIGTVSNMFRGVDIASMAIGQRLILSTPSSSSPIGVATVECIRLTHEYYTVESV
jgi:hypothetical protein